jgi:20S proteasome alpha/beta subunit
MTTIAFHLDSNTIAFDSRETAGSLIATDSANKSVRIGAEYYVSSGCVEDCELLIEILTKGVKCNRDLDANVMFTNNGKVFNSNFYVKDGVFTWQLKRNYTMGSGESFALAAMDFNRGAEDAVKYAMTRDIHTGGEVRVIKVK